MCSEGWKGLLWDPKTQSIRNMSTIALLAATARQAFRCGTYARYTGDRAQCPLCQPYLGGLLFARVANHVVRPALSRLQPDP